MPPFPLPTDEAVDELIEACPQDKCVALHDWIWRILNLKKQLALYEQ